MFLFLDSERSIKREMKKLGSLPTASCDEMNAYIKRLATAQSVKTVILISCRGGVTEEVKVNWESSSEDLLNSPPVQNRCRRIERRVHG